MFIFLLSGLFCCLGFSGVIFFAVWAGACFFLLFGRGPRPRPNSKKNHAPAQTAKKNTPPHLPIIFFFAVWAGGCVFFFAVWAGDVFFFFAVWAGGVFFFLLFGRGRVLFFAVWTGTCSFFCCVGRGRVYFFAVWAGDGSSLTYPSAWLVFKRPNNKRDRTAKKKTRVPECRPFSISSMFMQIYMHAYINHPSIHPSIHPYIHTYIHKYRHACIDTWAVHCKEYPILEGGEMLV